MATRIARISRTLAHSRTYSSCAPLLTLGSRDHVRSSEYGSTLRGTAGVHLTEQARGDLGC